jgi:NAD(P)-dependent dehydrogenase (short-subunit alcohol dehydrogenase family)
MTAEGSGPIVFIASEAGLRGSAAGAAYTASKRGIVGLVKNLAITYRMQGIHANAVAPVPPRPTFAWTSVKKPTDPPS